MNDLRKLALAATPGPWNSQFMGVFADDLTPIAEIEDSLRDAAYIAAASPDVILALLDENDRLRAALNRILDHGQRHLEEEASGTEVETIGWAHLATYDVDVARAALNADA